MTYRMAFIFLACLTQLSSASAQNELSCCTIDATNNVWGATNAPPLGFTNAHYVVDVGITLNINFQNPVVFDRCRFLMRAGSKIVINGGKSVTAVDSRFFPCLGGSWQGIVCGANNISFAALRDTIEGATIGIDMQSNQTLSVTNSLLRQNQVGIRVNSPTDLVQFTCEGNTFIGQTATNGTNIAIGDVGIFIQGLNTPITIGSTQPTALRNSFNNLRRGIELRQAVNVTVTNTQFRNINTYGSPNTTTTSNLNGTAIFVATNGALPSSNKLTLNDATGATTLLNAICGIYVEGQKVAVTGTKILGVETGIWAVRVAGIAVGGATTTANTISAKRNGIRLDFCANATTKITSNIISVGTVDSPPTLGAFNGILVNETGGTPNNTFDINNNTIAIGTNVANGIFVTGKVSGRIRNNTININAPLTNLAGVNLANCASLALDCNNITNTTSNRTLGNAVGLWLTATTNSTISCTRTNNTYTGIRIDGTCTGSYLKGTEFNNHTRGLWVFGGGTAVSNATLPNHLNYEGNQWLSGFDATNKAAYLGTNTSPAVGVYPPKFWYNADNPNMSQLFSNFTTQQVSQWFIEQHLGANDTRTFICPSSCVSINTGGGGTGGGSSNGGNMPVNAPDFGSDELAIAEQTVNFGVNQDVAIWEAQKALYAKVVEYNGVIADESPIDVFRDSIATTPIADFVTVETAEKQVLDIPAALKAQYSSYSIIADNYKLSLAYLDSLSQTTADSTVLAQYAAQHDAMLLQWTLTQAQISQLDAQIQTIRDSKIATALELNALLEDGEVYQYNHKLVIEIYLNTVAEGNTDFSTAQLADLSVIAHQCPYTGGKAVYEARAMYALYSDELYDDHALCEAIGIDARTANPHHSAATTKKEERDDVKVYPNPANELVSLLVPDSYQGATIQLTNAIGQELQIRAINSRISTLNLRELPEGIYFMSIRQNGQILYQTKLVHLP